MGENGPGICPAGAEKPAGFIGSKIKQEKGKASSPDAFPETSDGNADRRSGICGFGAIFQIIWVNLMVDNLFAMLREIGVVIAKNAVVSRGFTGVTKEGREKVSVTKGKEKLSVYLWPDTLKSIQDNYRKDDCRSKSEFIEKAVRYYTGRLSAKDEASYLPNAFLSNMKAIAYESDNRNGRILFKIAVELAMIMNLLAAYHEVDSETVEKLQRSCIEEVKRLNGSFSFKDAVDWQNG